MKTILALAVVSGLMLQYTFGQGAQGAAITQRARDMRDQNNAQQGVPPKSQPGAPSSGRAAPVAQPPAPKAPTPASPAQIQQQNINKLRNDIAAFLVDEKVSQEKIQKFATNLTATARGPRKPSADAIRKLATTIGTQLAGKTLGSAEQLRLAENLDAVVNGAKLSRLQTEAYVADVQKILQGAGVKTDDAAAVAVEVKATVTGLKP